NNTVKRIHVMWSEVQRVAVVPHEMGTGILIPYSSLEDGRKVLVMVAEIALDAYQIVSQALCFVMIVVSADNADIHTAHGMKISGARHDFKGPNALAGWTHADDKVSWNVKIQRPGQYDVLIEYLPLPTMGGTVVFHTEGSQVTYSFESKEGRSFEEAKMGTIEIPQKAIGEPFVPFVLEAAIIDGNGLPEISSVSLVPKEN